MKLAIIGTAGRGEDGKRLASDPNNYIQRMLDAAKKVSEITGSTDLISGAAAWADHIAVLLFRDNPDKYSIELELASPLVSDGNCGYKFDDKGTGDFKNNCGAISNHYHKQFKKAFHKSRPSWNPAPAWSPFDDFFALNCKRANHPEKVIFNVGTGFLERNLEVAQKADHCLAMTFGNGKRLKDGGTAHTMSNFLVKGMGTAWHLDLNTLKLYEGAVVS